MGDEKRKWGTKEGKGKEGRGRKGPKAGLIKVGAAYN